MVLDSIQIFPGSVDAGVTTSDCVEETGRELGMPAFHIVVCTEQYEHGIEGSLLSCDVMSYPPFLALYKS